jgi:hypothetical protein
MEPGQVWREDKNNLWLRFKIAKEENNLKN